MNTTELPNFGIEIETVGISREKLARAIHSVTGGHLAATYDGASVTMIDGRIWKVVRDGSLNGYENGEIVSPILSYSDLDVLQSIVRAVREAGAKCDESTGIHIHVDGARFDAKSLTNLINIVHKNERIIERALKVSPERLSRYTRSIDSALIARLETQRPTTLEEMNVAWYGTQRAPCRYDSSRYHGLNLNSFFYRKTIEFRYFNGTLHAGEIKAYVQFVLAVANRALSTKSTSRARREIAPQHEKWAFALLLKTFGMIGAEFKTARHHLLKHLEGNISNPGRAAVRATEAA